MSSLRRLVWKARRDSLVYWNVVTSSRDRLVFDESGALEQLLLYRSRRDGGPWDVIAISPGGFFNLWFFFEGVGGVFGAGCRT
jgi:hypothetical protein